MADAKILFSKICALEDLTCFYCTYNINEKRDKSVQSNFHFQILKCRMLIFSSPQILATPNLYDDSQIIVIYNRNVQDSYEIRNLLNKINLQVQLSANVTPELLEICFKYTLTARIAPLWNQVGDDMFIKGREFLLEPSALEAISISVHSSENSIRFILKCFKINLQHMDINDLNIATNSLNYFNNVSDAVLSEYSFLDKWIHVLPSLKKGRIIGVSRTLPVTSCFKNYQDLRRYWKNIYGYRLPMDDMGIFYYEVHFRPLGPHIFTYPSICLRANAPIKIVPSELLINKIANVFLKDVHVNLSNILGCKTDFKSTDPIKNIPFSNIDNIPSPFTKFKEYKDIENFNIFQHKPKCDESYKFTSQNTNLCIPIQKATIFKPTFLPKILNYSFNNGNIIKTENSQKHFNIKNNEILHKDTNTNEIRIFNKTNPNSFSAQTHITRVSNNDLINQDSEENNFNISLSQRNGSFIKDVTNLSPNKKTISEDSKCHESPLSTNNISKEIKQDCSPIVNVIKGVKKNSKCPESPLSTNNILKETKQNCSPIVNIIKGVKKNSNTECLNNCEPKKAKKREADASKMDEISTLAKTNPEDLKKITVPTLYLWLKSNNHHVTKKTTKPQLIEKILSTLKE